MQEVYRITADQAAARALDWDLSIRRIDDEGRVFEHDPDGSVHRVIWDDDHEFVVSLKVAERDFAWAS